MSIPTFRKYYPSENDMNKNQLTFYRHLEDNLRKENYLPVDGQISYLFVYVYKLLNHWKSKGYEKLYDQLLNLAEAYYLEDKFASYCKFWSYDCLLATNQLELFLEISEPAVPFGTDTHFSNLRLNVQYKLGRLASGVDLFKVFGKKSTYFTQSNPGLFRDCLEECFLRDQDLHGSWLKRILKHRKTNNQLYKHSLFQGAPIAQPKMSFDIYCFYAAYEIAEEIQLLFREAENRLRDIEGVPRIGEGWITETNLYRTIAEAFPETQIVHHGQPNWLGRQHFDIWFPHWKIAVEYQGVQHFKPVEYFGGEAGFKETQKRDIRKRELAEKHGVTLLYSSDETSHEEIIAIIKNIRNKR